MAQNSWNFGGGGGFDQMYMDYILKNSVCYCHSLKR